MLKFLILLFVFSLNNALAKNNIFLIENVEVILDSPEINQAREISKNIAFNDAFRELLKKIMKESEHIKVSFHNPIEINYYVQDYKIRNEDFFDSTYKAVIDVNFNKKRVNKFLADFQLNSSNTTSENFLIIPVYFNLNTNYLWEKKNRWYESLKDEYDDSNLLKLFFAQPNSLNKFRISAKEALRGDLDKLKNIVSFYDKKSAIIIYLEEKFDLDSESFYSNVDFKLFTNNKVENILENNSNLKNLKSKRPIIDLLAKFSISDLNNWWKDRTTVSKFSERKLNEFRIIDNFDDLKKSYMRERIIRNNSFTDNLKTHQITKGLIEYKLFSFADIEKINISLSAMNLKLEFISEENAYEIQENF